MLALLGARKWLSVGLICAAVVLGACGRGGPGAGSLSSDDVFKVELRTAIRDVNFDPDEEGSEEYFIREWRLDVPQSYIYTIVISNAFFVVVKFVVTRAGRNSVAAFAANNDDVVGRSVKRVCLIG